MDAIIHHGRGPRRAAELRIGGAPSTARYNDRVPTPRDVVIISAARTPIGSFQGALASLSAPKLGAAAIKEALARAGIDGDARAGIGEVYMGNVLPAGIGQAPARQASIGAGIPDSVGAVTVNKVCGSG
jgi:acetyl-CoA C-acetyltransferase